MAGKVDIVNMALTRLALAPIGSLAEATRQAMTAAREFDNARDCVLRDFQWGFASREIPLAPLSSRPASHRYAYAVPGDCLFVRKVVSGGREAEYTLGDIDGFTVILTDANPVSLAYTLRIENTERFDPLFVDALAWRLGLALATGVASDTEKAQIANSMYEAVLNRARVSAAEEEEVADDRISSYQAGRR